MPVLIALSVFVTVTAAVMAILQARTATAVAAQARLDRLAGRNDYADWNAPASALRTNRISSIAWMERLLTDFEFTRGIELTLVRADWNMRVAEFLATCMLGAVVGFFIGGIALHVPLLGVGLAVVGSLVPVFVLRRAAKKRIGKIEKQLVEMLVMLSNGLKAGFGLMQTIDQAARQLDAPIADELKKLRRDTQVGSSIEEAITEFGRRVGSYDLEIVVTAILVQRNVGGNLSEILDNVAHTIRERDRIKGEIQTLVAEQKMSGMVIAAVPPIVAVLFYLLNRNYMMTLFIEPAGRIALTIAVVMECVGAYMIKRIIDIDV